MELSVVHASSEDRHRLLDKHVRDGSQAGRAPWLAAVAVHGPRLPSFAQDKLASDERIEPHREVDERFSRVGPVHRPF